MMPSMRTTVTLDADVVRTLKDEVHRSGRPFKVVLNQAIRHGLAPNDPRPRARYRLKAHASRLAPGVDPLRFNQLADELEDSAGGRS